MEDLSMRMNATELLDELGWLRRLARSLVGPVGAEEDLVQETWLAASRVEGGVTRAWLVATLRNLAASLQRRESRLRRREGAAARPELIDAESLLERNELFGVVLEQLRSLEMPFRSVLLLIYQEGLSVREAAERMGTPVDTLRWQHREGLARLRQTLDGKNGRQDHDWRAAFLPLLKLPSTDLISGGSALGTAAKTLSLLAGVTMTWKLTTVAVVAGLAGMFAIFGADESAPLPFVGTPPANEAVADAPESMSLEELDRPEASRQVVDSTPFVARGMSASVAPTSGATLEVTVVTAVGTPVAGARVWAGDTPDPVDAFWETNPMGLAVIPLGEDESATVSSSAPGLFGNSNYFLVHSGGEVRVVLFPDADIRVLIVDQEGQPLEGVPVSRGGKYKPKVYAQTGPEGIAVLRHILDPFKFNRQGRDFTVGPAVLLRDSVHVTVARDHVPSEPVRIVMPPTGELNIRVLDSKGRLNSEAKEVDLFRDPNPGVARNVLELTAMAKTIRWDGISIAVKGGVAHVPFVGLGLNIVAEARQAEPTESTFGFGLGPQGVDEREELDLRPLDVAPVLTGIALHPDGRVMKNRLLKGRISLISRAKAEAALFEVQTDEYGSFSIVVEKNLSKQWAAMEWRKVEIEAPLASPFDRSFFSTALPDSIHAGDNYIGEAYMQDDVPFVLGHAVDSDGKPVEISYADVWIRSDVDGSLSRILYDARLTITGDAFGFFGDYLESDLENGEYYELMVMADDRPRIYTRVSLGPDDREFVFEDGASVDGSVIVQKGDLPTNYIAYFYILDDRGKRLERGQASLFQNGDFVLTGLTKVLGEVEIRPVGSRKVAALIPGILPGLESAEQQELLQGIDIRPVLLDYRLAVIDEQGREIDAAFFDSPDVPYATRDDEYYSLRWSLDRQRLEGKVTAPGYKSVDVVLLPGDQSVVMSRGLEVIVRPSALPTLPQDAEFLVVLDAVDIDEVVQLQPLGDGSFRGFLSGSGEYRVRGRLFHRAVLLNELPFTVDPYASIEVLDQVLTQDFEVPIDVQVFEDSLPLE
ncbi:MAG: RNA polymerase sigma factor (sigma-70 family) [Planctomycetota bacterium]|jgi:RNA polymerase sigma factor (sigma-70 family)